MTSRQPVREVQVRLAEGRETVRSGSVVLRSTVGADVGVRRQVGPATQAALIFEGVHVLIEQVGTHDVVDEPADRRVEPEFLRELFPSSSPTLYLLKSVGVLSPSVRLPLSWDL